MDGHQGFLSYYPIVTAGYEVRIQTGQEMLDSGS